MTDATLPSNERVSTADLEACRSWLVARGDSLARSRDMILMVDELLERRSSETRACVAMREAGKHVFCGATPNWIDHAGDCDALPCICGLSEWLNTNKDLLGITLSHSQKAGEPQCSGLCSGLPDANCPVHGLKATLSEPEQR